MYPVPALPLKSLGASKIAITPHHHMEQCHRYIFTLLLLLSTEVTLLLHFQSQLHKVNYKP